MVPAVCILCIVWIQSLRRPGSVLSTEADRCWLREAVLRGDFLIGSHRSMGDSHFARQPATCLEGLAQLKSYNISYLDLDMIYDPSSDQIVIAHPTEFKGTAECRSPCALTPLQSLFKLLQNVFEQEPWLVSLEPKVDWYRTNDSKSLLKEPTVVLEHTLSVMEQFDMKPTHCTLFVDANRVIAAEEPLLNKLSRHCSLSYAVRRHEGLDAQKAVQRMDFEYIMPTIEFHPSHPHYRDTTGIESLRITQQTVPKSVYWEVDTKEDLERVASFRGAGLVSNRPLFVAELLQDPKHSWCSGGGPIKAEKMLE